MRQAAESGLMAKWQRDWLSQKGLTPSARTVFHISSIVVKAASLGLNDTQGAFYISGVLMAAGIVALVLELLCRPIRNLPLHSKN